MALHRLMAAALSAMLWSGCISPTLHLFRDDTEPFQEVTLEGTAREKVLLISLEGVLSDRPRSGLLQDRPSPVQEVVARLRRAEKDTAVRAVVLKINSPGGTVTATDILYHELMRFKTDRDVKVVAAMMDVAASGGYYAALPADRIVAHPTTVTGSIGVIFLRPNVEGLAERLGIDVTVSRSGENKDMGSPFREPTEGEDRLFQELTDRLADRFFRLVQQHRRLSGPSFAEARTGRVFHAEAALAMGLVDRIGYLDDAIEEARHLSGMPKDARVIAYRRRRLAEDTVYTSPEAAAGRPALVDLGPANPFARLGPGLHCLWLPGIQGP